LINFFTIKQAESENLFTNTTSLHTVRVSSHFENRVGPEHEHQEKSLFLLFAYNTKAFIENMILRIKASTFI